MVLHHIFALKLKSFYLTGILMSLLMGTIPAFILSMRGASRHLIHRFPHHSVSISIIFFGTFLIIFTFTALKSYHIQNCSLTNIYLSRIIWISRVKLTQERICACCITSTENILYFPGLDVIYCLNFVWSLNKNSCSQFSFYTFCTGVFTAKNRINLSIIFKQLRDIIMGDRDAFCEYQKNQYANKFIDVRFHN